MHELALAKRMIDIIEGVSSQHGGARVLRARLLLGELGCAEPETLTFAFRVVRRGTCADCCDLEISRVPLRLRCRSCSVVQEGGDYLGTCAACGSIGFEVLEGRELRLESVEIEE
ncbi:MAG: hydrogenase maturation nickel metallochaperone HypA [Pseudomonadota bacterium]